MSDRECDHKVEIVARALCNQSERATDKQIEEKERQVAAQPNARLVSSAQLNWKRRIEEAERFIRAYEALKAFDAAQGANEGMKPDELNAENDG